MSISEIARFYGCIMQEYCLLACQRFSGRHTAENIAVHFKETVEQFNIAGNVSHIVTDNAATTKNAFIGLPGCEHNDIDERESEEEEEEEEKYDEDGMDATGLIEYLSQHQSCFAHTLQPVIKYALKDADKLKRTVVKVCSIVSHVI